MYAPCPLEELWSERAIFSSSIFILAGFLFISFCLFAFIILLDLLLIVNYERTFCLYIWKFMVTGSGLTANSSWFWLFTLTFYPFCGDLVWSSKLSGHGMFFEFLEIALFLNIFCRVIFGTLAVCFPEIIASNSRIFYKEIELWIDSTSWADGRFVW